MLLVQLVLLSFVASLAFYLSLYDGLLQAIVPFDVPQVSCLYRANDIYYFFRFDLYFVKNFVVFFNFFLVSCVCVCVLGGRVYGGIGLPISQKLIFF